MSFYYIRITTLIFSKNLYFYLTNNSCLLIMSKRSNADGQARREEVEARDDDESEEAGIFSRADASVVAQRKIVKVRK